MKLTNRFVFFLSVAHELAKMKTKIQQFMEGLGVVRMWSTCPSIDLLDLLPQPVFQDSKDSESPPETLDVMCVAPGDIGSILMTMCRMGRREFASPVSTSITKRMTFNCESMPVICRHRMQFGRSLMQCNDRCTSTSWRKIPRCDCLKRNVSEIGVYFFWCRFLPDTFFFSTSSWMMI